MTGPIRILLIDDDIVDRLTITRALKQSSLTVEIVEARTASEGLEQARAQNFDAILLDYYLPDQNGLEVLQKLRADSTDHSVIIMLTSREDDALAAQCIDAGAQDFLLKDEVNGRRLRRTIRQAQQLYAMSEELRSSHERLRNLAEHDRLTGLANRYSFEVALQIAVARAQRKQCRIAVMLLDLDDFKSVNDTLGHDVGDELLKSVAQRLASAVRESDLLARLGGDEFVVLAQDLDRDDQANMLAERLLESLQAPVQIGEVALQVTTSIGVAVFEHCDGSTTDLVKCADIAMYRAKNGGRNQVHFYSDIMNEMMHQRTGIEHALKLALERGQFQLHYQAQIAADSEKVIGIEALLRWQHPERGLLLPEQFLAIAEELNLMESIGDWVLRTACLQHSKWRQISSLADLHLSIAVNLSTLQTRGKSLLGSVDQALSDNQLPAHRLELEITEQTLIQILASEPPLTDILDQLAARGVILSLDDFGAGFSSIKHLKLFPIQILKIDQEFIATIGKGVKEERLLAAMFRFAQALKLTVVAEGVETREQADFCRQQGCDRLQGFLYSIPLPAAEFEAKFLSDVPCTA